MLFAVGCYACADVHLLLSGGGCLVLVVRGVVWLRAFFVVWCCSLHVTRCFGLDAL